VNSVLRSALWALLALAVCTSKALAQDLEPRSYSNSPVGLNFLIAGYGYTEGNVAFDPSVPLTDARLHTNSTVFAYVRTLEAWGQSAKFDVVLPYTLLSGSALYVGQPREREASGFADPRFRVSVNFLGAPALTAQEFSGYRQDLIVGASVQVTMPWGQYDPSKLVNIGTNRWSIKPELGISKAWDSWILEIAPSVTFYGDNHDFLSGGTIAQAPLYAVQGHLVHSFHSGIWVALDTVFFTGARTTVNGVEGNTMQRNTRAGLTVALPVNRNNSLKLNFSGGVSSRTGSSYNALGIAWQYRWGGGF
jgi:hypothetical protein